jgi:hypothetical protein
VGTIIGVVAAFLAFLQSFGVPVSDDQQAAIRGLVAVLAPLVAGLVIRQFVWSPNSVVNENQASYEAGLSDGADPNRPTRHLIR